MDGSVGTRERHFSAADLADREGWLRLAEEHYENFPVGSWLLPKAQRLHLRRIYAFARAADDIADEHKDAAWLAEFGAAFRRALAGDQSVRLLADLADSIRQLGLPQGLFEDLLAAFASDLEVRRHDEASLLAYCSRSANPVGRLVLRVCGQEDPERDRLSDSICTGLQILNHLQDLREDAVERDVVYLPREDLARLGVAEEELRGERASPGVRALVEHWCGRTTAMFRAGAPLLGLVQGRLRRELAVILRLAAALLAAIRDAGYDVLASHVRLRRGQKLRAAALGLVWPRAPRMFR
jgi:squalene synthase HpnC